MKKFRWGWFAVACFAILTTPGAVIDAIQLFRSDHRLGFILPVAFVIRVGMIWWFLKLWWDTRASEKDKEGSESN
jgi:hypothetical protein